MLHSVSVENGTRLVMVGSFESSLCVVVILGRERFGEGCFDCC